MRVKICSLCCLVFLSHDNKNVFLQADYTTLTFKTIFFFTADLCIILLLLLKIKRLIQYNKYYGKLFMPAFLKDFFLFLQTLDLIFL